MSRLEQTAWTPSTTEGRWCGFGPYYAMFPVEFVRRVVSDFCPAKGRVLDPFCGRGATPFVALATGREALAAEINPVGWIYTAVKLDPCKRVMALMDRVHEVLESVRAEDWVAENDFQRAAWHPQVLAFLKAARRGLNWRVSRTDRTLMAILLVHLHAKKGEGLSNQLRQSKAMSPAYSVRWWKAHKMRPPKIDVPVFFAKKFQWRYAKGVPSNTGRARAKLGDARYVLPQIEEFGADLVLTSPPYSGVTNYQYDNWIRLWMLGGPPLPSRGTAHRFRDPENYETLLEDVFRETRRLSKDNATICVRTDAREFTLQTTLDVLTKLWPAHRMSIRFDTAASRTQTSLFQDKWHQAGEVDILLTSRRRPAPSKFYKQSRRKAARELP